MSSPTKATYSKGDLGKFASIAAIELAQTGWDQFIQQRQFPTSVSSMIHTINHPTAEYLARLASAGAPLLGTTPPWTLQQRDAAFYRGPHPSAATEYAAFLAEDMCDYICMGYWLVLPYNAVRHYAQLRISPAGVVPQQERRPHPIMDYSYSGVNQASFPIQPHQSMQFGSTLQRLLQRLVYCNLSFVPPLLAKLDLADGYYQVPLSPVAALQLAVVIPNDLPGPDLVAIPLTLPMGWSHSPPYFCAYTETIADIANASPGDSYPIHPLLNASQTSSTLLPPGPNHFHPFCHRPGF
jgi:hypothetical protein